MYVEVLEELAADEGGQQTANRRGGCHNSLSLVAIFPGNNLIGKVDTARDKDGVGQHLQDHGKVQHADIRSKQDNCMLEGIDDGREYHQSVYR